MRARREKYGRRQEVSVQGETVGRRESSKNVKKKNNVGNLHIAALMWVNHGENHDPTIS